MHTSRTRGETWRLGGSIERTRTRHCIAARAWLALPRSPPHFGLSCRARLRLHAPHRVRHAHAQRRLGWMPIARDVRRLGQLDDANMVGVRRRLGDALRKPLVDEQQHADAAERGRAQQRCPSAPFTRSFRSGPGDAHPPRAARNSETSVAKQVGFSGHSRIHSRRRRSTCCAARRSKDSAIS